MDGHPYRHDEDNRRGLPGVILLITLVILVILSTLGYTVSVRVAARRHRNQYTIDYDIARHACVSGMKYALASVNSLDFELISRPNEPDFSDVFALSEPDYQKLLAQMELYLTQKSLSESDSGKDTATGNRTSRLKNATDVNDVNEVGLASTLANVQIPGPYGPPWPLVTEPVELEIGSAKVKIEIEDENAKYPLGWAMLDDEKLRDVAGAGWTTFCEWMGYKPQEIAGLNKDLTAIAAKKAFKVEFKVEAAAADAPANLRSRITRPTTGTAGSAVARRAVRTKPVSVEEQVQNQSKEFARLFHSSLLDTALLSRQSIESDTRKESAMKYLGLWATRQVNVNTAPRNVLEAALSFGSIIHAPKMAEAIIQQRKIKPIADVNEVKQSLLGYSDSVEQCREFLTATSTVFTIRVTAVSGAAKVTTVAAVSKEGDKIQQIAVICE